MLSGHTMQEQHCCGGLLCCHVTNAGMHTVLHHPGLLCELNSHREPKTVLSIIIRLLVWSGQNSIVLMLMGSLFVPSRAPWQGPCMLQYAVAEGSWKRCKILNNVTLPIIQQPR